MKHPGRSLLVKHQSVTECKSEGFIKGTTLYSIRRMKSITSTLFESDISISHYQGVERRAANQVGPGSKRCTDPPSQFGFPKSTGVAQTESSEFHVIESPSPGVLVASNKLSVDEQSAEASRISCVCRRSPSH